MCPEGSERPVRGVPGNLDRLYVGLAAGPVGELLDGREDPVIELCHLWEVFAISHIWPLTAGS